MHEVFILVQYLSTLLVFQLLFYIKKNFNYFYQLRTEQKMIADHSNFYVRKPQYRLSSRLGQSHFSPLCGARGGTPSVYWQAGGGDLHMYTASYTHTLGPWDGFFKKFYSR
jgi:hypothetical protein